MFLLSLPRGGESTTRDKERKIYIYSTYSIHYTRTAKRGTAAPDEDGKCIDERDAQGFLRERVKKTMSSKGKKEKESNKREMKSLRNER